jgi:hypothetical protein
MNETDVETKIDIDIPNVLPNESKISLSINGYLYDKFKDNLKHIIKSYNYVRLTRFNNEYKNKKLSKSIARTINDFFSKLSKFMIDAIRFKNTLINKFKINEKQSINVIIFSILNYITHIIRNDKNINFSKIQLLDQLINYNREDIQEDNIPIDTKFFEKWINNILIAEYDISMKLNEKTYKFHSCGESLTLNIMNYVLLE